MKKAFPIILVLFLFICLLITGCNSQKATFKEELRKEISKEIAANMPQSNPSSYIPFGDGNWHNACVITKGTEFLIYTNQKFGGAAKTVIWISYDKKTEFSIKGYEEHPYFTKDEPNKGENAELISTNADVNQLEWKMESDGIDAKEIEKFKKSGNYFYRISINADDNGYHASYIVKQTNAANKALIKATLDDTLSSRATVHYPATKSTSDVKIDCKPITRITTVDLNKKPLTGAEFAYSINGEKSKGTLDNSTLELDMETLPSTIFFSKNIGGKTVRNSLDSIKIGKTYQVILATEEERIKKYKEDLNRYGKIIWGDEFDIDKYFKFDMNNEGITQFETNIIKDTYNWNYGVIRFDGGSLGAEDVDTPYHEAFHALWEYSSIENAGGTRDDIWSPLPSTPANNDVDAENFALDEAQAHMGGFYALQYYKGIDLEDSEFNMENAKKAINKTNVSGNEIEGIVTTFLLELYKDASVENVLKDMKDVKDSYYVTNNKYPQNLREFLSEKLKVSDQETRTKIINLANELNISTSIAPADNQPDTDSTEALDPNASIENNGSVEVTKD